LKSSEGAGKSSNLPNEKRYFQPSTAASLTLKRNLESKPRLTKLTLKSTFISTDKEVAMPQTLSIMEARKQLTSLPETLFNNGQPDVLVERKMIFSIWRRSFSG
jgi:hypothetical protein